MDSLFIFMYDSIKFKETVSKLCNIEHFYMLMNNQVNFSWKKE